MYQYTCCQAWPNFTKLRLSRRHRHHWNRCAECRFKGLASSYSKVYEKVNREVGSLMQSLQTLMHQLEGSSRWQASAYFRQLLALWPQLVGPAVAQNSQPRTVYRGVLQVSVSSAAWAQTLMFERRRILAKLHQQVPATTAMIHELRFSTGRWPPSQLGSPLTKTALTAHPSWVHAPPAVQQPLPSTAAAAFSQWSQQRRRQLADQGCCPECQCPCPRQELQRWPVCAICMTHRWQTPVNSRSLPPPTRE